MRMAMIGLGRMGGNMARRLCRAGIEVVGYNRSAEVTHNLAAEEGMIATESLEAAVAALSPPRVIWLMLPSGGPTESTLSALSGLLERGDLVVDGGNANYRDTLRRAEQLAEQGLELVDAGTSGGVWGLDNGYCMMVGGSEAAVARIEPALRALAPSPTDGWARVGPIGAGHFSKMIHNGIEYGMMQALAEGLAILHEKREMEFDLAQLTELWRHGSVVRSWLLDLTADALAEDQSLAEIAPVVADSGEGRWSAKEAIDLGVAAPVITLALHQRFTSQDKSGYGNRALAMMRNAFGGHSMTPSEQRSEGS